MTTKVYKFLGIDTAMLLLRPGAKWEISNNVFTRWDDPRPCPSIEEVYWVIDKIKEFEDSIPTIWLPKQLEEMGIKQKEIEDAIAAETSDNIGVLLMFSIIPALIRTNSINLLLVKLPNATLWSLTYGLLTKFNVI